MQQVMEFLVLFALVLLGFSVLVRRNRRAGAPPALAMLKISDPVVAHRALVENADGFANRPLPPFLVALANSRGGQLGEAMLSVRYGPHWRALRCNLTAETLHPLRLVDLPPLHQESIQALVAGLSAAGEGAIAIGDHLDVAVFRVVARLCFGDGVDECHVRAMRSAVRGTQQVAVGGDAAVPGSVLAKLAEWNRHRRQFAFHSHMSQLVTTAMAARQQESRGRPCDGRRPYIDSLIDLRVPDTDDGACRRALGDDEIVNLAMEFLGAGTGPAVVCLEWTLAHLVAQPEAQEKLRREIDAEADRDAVTPNRGQLIRGMPYLHAVVLESLRMHPPVPFLVRQVQPDASRVLVGGSTEPAATDLIAQFVTGAIGMDNKTWKDPDVFRPERFMAGGEAEGVGPLPGRKEIRMMPFGTGHRFCPGVGLGMMTVKCFVAALVREFEWSPPTDDVVDLTELDGFMKTMKKPLCARLTRRT